MCDNDKMVVIATDMFKNKMIVSKGTRHSHTKHPEEADVTVLLGGRIEFNSYLHRRDMVDVMLQYNLYIKKIKTGTNAGRYQAGVHDTIPSVIKDKPTTAVSEMAYAILSGDKSELVCGTEL